MQAPQQAPGQATTIPDNTSKIVGKLIYDESCVKSDRDLFRDGYIDFSKDKLRIRNFDGFVIYRSDYNKNDDIFAENNDEYLVLICGMRIEIFRIDSFRMSLRRPDTYIMSTITKLTKVRVKSIIQTLDIGEFDNIFLLSESFYVSGDVYSRCVNIILEFNYRGELLSILPLDNYWNMIKYGDNILLHQYHDNTRSQIQKYCSIYNYPEGIVQINTLSTISHNLYPFFGGSIRVSKKDTPEHRINEIIVSNCNDFIYPVLKRIMIDGNALNMEYFADNVLYMQDVSVRDRYVIYKFILPYGVAPPSTL